MDELKSNEDIKSYYNGNGDKIDDQLLQGKKLSEYHSDYQRIHQLYFKLVKEYINNGFPIQKAQSEATNKVKVELENFNKKRREEIQNKYSNKLNFLNELYDVVESSYAQIPEKIQEQIADLDRNYEQFNKNYDKVKGNESRIHLKYIILLSRRILDNIAHPEKINKKIQIKEEFANIDWEEFENFADLCTYGVNGIPLSQFLVKSFIELEQETTLLSQMYVTGVPERELKVYKKFLEIKGRRVLADFQRAQAQLNEDDQIIKK